MQGTFKGYKNLPTVFICRSGGRSARAARLAQQHGFKKIFNMQGGMLEWNKQGLPALGRNQKKQAA